MSKRGEILKKLVVTKHGKFGIKTHVFEPSDSIDEVHFCVKCFREVIGPRPCPSVGIFE